LPVSEALKNLASRYHLYAPGHTLGTVLSKPGVAPHEAQAALPAIPLVAQSKRLSL
jgi:hypothetical protein